MTDLAAEETKACCARSYQSDVVALILGESYHPGGLELTRRLARSLDVRSGQKVLDVASGPGATAFLLAAEFGVDVEGVDLGEQSVAKANARAAEQGVDDRVRFTVGDAERLPLPDGSVDAVVCECAFCTFPDKPTAARELARVLRPGGRFALVEMTSRFVDAPWLRAVSRHPADRFDTGQLLAELERHGLHVPPDRVTDRVGGRWVQAVATLG
jgi:ubiquinone/menaquinone biosynthesis C-methylase UbiE